ncbi:MAG: hypothetical protein ACRCVT_05770, partial [Leadbetterella sp.]
MKSSKLDEIIFENRNKAYGAYDLRTNYSKHVSYALGIGVGISCLLLFSAFTFNKEEIKVKPDDTIRIIPFTTERIKPIK